MESLQTQILQFIRTGVGSFDELALSLFRYQFERNVPYRAFCEALGKTPANVSHWSAAPAVPIAAFKSTVLTTFPASRAAAIFHSSATTTGTPSKHYLLDMRFYEESLKSSFLKHFLDGKTEQRYSFLILTPTPGDAPQSSLTWMMEVIRRAWGEPNSQYLITRGRLDEPRLSALLKTSEQQSRPVMLLGTTLAFLKFFDYCQARSLVFHLPPSSRMMDTGGMKTESRTTTREAFVDQAHRFLGLSTKNCINEYGMCEMSSQLYSRGVDAVLRGPAWLRSQVLDLSNGTPVEEGGVGVLRHFDLANIDSVAALQTEDQARRIGEGFELLGRIPQAELKGCSLTTEALLR